MGTIPATDKRGTAQGTVFGRTESTVRDCHGAQLRHNVLADQLQPSGLARVRLLPSRRCAECARHAEMHVHYHSAVARAEEVE